MTQIFVKLTHISKPSLYPMPCPFPSFPDPILIPPFPVPSPFSAPVPTHSLFSAPIPRPEFDF